VFRSLQDRNSIFYRIEARLLYSKLPSPDRGPKLAPSYIAPRRVLVRAATMDTGPSVIREHQNRAYCASSQQLPRSPPNTLSSYHRHRKAHYCG